MRKSAIQRSLTVLGLGLLLAGVTARLSAAHAPTLPMPCWGGCGDDVQYFPPGTEFKLSREAAAMQAAKADAAAQGSPTLAAPPGIAPGAMPVPGGPGPIPLAPGPAPGNP